MKTVKMKKKIICDVCNKDWSLYDAKTKMGEWAYMCLHCYKIYGIGLGLGKGQKIIYSENQV